MEFLYDGINPVQETSGGTILANILPGLDIDEFLTRTDVVAGTTSNFLADALGSPLAVTDNAGVAQTEYSYEAFGRPTATGASNSSSYHYTGRENDGTGLHYYRTRYYHPTLQRFISEDSIGFGGGINLFTYVVNNPMTLVDPFGQNHRPVPMGNPSKCLIRCMIEVESSNNPDAESPKGAKGLMQLTPIAIADVKDLHLIPNDMNVDPFDPGQNVAVGGLYITYLMGHYGNNADLATAAYNAGMGAVARAGRNIPKNKEAQEYVEKIKKCLNGRSAVGCC